MMRRRNGSRNAAENLALTPEQRNKIREMHATFVDKYRANPAERRDLVEGGVCISITAELTPEQREKARHYIEGRMVHASMAQSVAERLRTAADKLGLTQEQRSKIREIHAPLVDKYRALADERRALLHAELKAISKELTSDQRERVQDLCEDRVVVVGVEFDPNDPDAVAQLRETVADRLRALADKLGLTDEQRNKIREAHAAFAEKYEAQRTQRREFRRKDQGTRNGADTRSTRESQELHRGSGRVHRESMAPSAIRLGCNGNGFSPILSSRDVSPSYPGGGSLEVTLGRRTRSSPSHYRLISSLSICRASRFSLSWWVGFRPSIGRGNSIGFGNSATAGAAISAFTSTVPRDSLPYPRRHRPFPALVVAGALSGAAFTIFPARNVLIRSASLGNRHRSFRRPIRQPSRQLVAWSRNFTHRTQASGPIAACANPPRDPIGPCS